MLLILFFLFLTIFFKKDSFAKILNVSGARTLNKFSNFLFNLPPIRSFFLLLSLLLSSLFLLINFTSLTFVVNNFSSIINNPVAINAFVPSGAIKFF